MAGPKVSQRHRSVLPPNASLLERAIDGNFPADWGSLADQAEPSGDPDALQPWVVAHWQLSQFDRYFADPRELLAKGLPWLRERGSAASVRRAMGWLGYRGVKIEEDGALLHIDPGREITAADLRYLAHVVKASLPLHVRFYRVFHRLDRRVLRTNSRPGLNHGLLQADSGTPMDAGDGTTIIVSQGAFNGGTAPRLTGARIPGGHCTAKGGRMRRTDWPLLNLYRLGSPVRKPLAGAAAATHGGAAPAYVRLACYGDTIPRSAPSNAIASPLGQPLGAAASQVGRDLPRTVPDRTWETGGWDGETWQTTDIAGGNIVIQE